MPRGVRRQDKSYHVDVTVTPEQLCQAKPDSPEHDKRKAGRREKSLARGEVIRQNVEIMEPVKVSSLAMNVRYSPDFCERIVKLGAQGKTRAQMASDIGVSQRGMMNWVDKYPEFAEAMELAITYAQAYWEKMGEESLWADRFNTGVYIRLMAARFPHEYSNRVIMGGDAANPITVQNKIVDAKELTFEQRQILRDALQSATRQAEARAIGNTMVGAAVRAARDDGGIEPDDDDV